MPEMPRDQKGQPESEKCVAEVTGTKDGRQW